MDARRSIAHSITLRLGQIGRLIPRRLAGYATARQPTSTNGDTAFMNPITGLLTALGGLTIVFIGGWAKAFAAARQLPARE